MSKTIWNTVAINQDVSDTDVKELIDHSYELIFKSLTRKSTRYREFLMSFVDTFRRFL
jgi:predicted DNA-binding protein (MmcQ/YjbR family)